MKPPPPRLWGDGGALRRSGSLLLIGNLSQTAFPPQAPSPPDHQVDDRCPALGETRAQWWRQWRAGNRLPAERRVVVLPGGRP